MSREIKFRAWYKTLNIMCDVAAINFYHGNVVLLARNEEQRKLFQKMNKEVFVECDDRLSVSMKEVHLMQYTDLEDKNGKEIYDGDIIKYNFKSLSLDKSINRDRISSVFWQNFRAIWAVKDNKSCNSDLFRYVQNGNVVEVIGNIHEKLELLEGE